METRNRPLIEKFLSIEEMPNQGFLITDDSVDIYLGVLNNKIKDQRYLCWTETESKKIGLLREEDVEIKLTPRTFDTTRLGSATLASCL